jgi:hypothetical protein
MSEGEPATTAPALIDPSSAGEVPAERLYWAILDPAPLGRTRIAPSECGCLFEDVLPVSIESVHACYRWLDDGRVVACGIDRGELERIDRSELLALRPNAVPEPICLALASAAAATSDNAANPAATKAAIWLGVDDFNLLTGPYEPPRVRTLRRRWVALSAAFVAASLGCVAVGVIRRGAAIDRAIAEVDARRSDLVQAVYAQQPAASGLPPEYRLLGELRSLSGTRASTLAPLVDAGPTAAALLSTWPREIEARCDAVAIQPRSVTIRGTAADNSAVARIEQALRSVADWRLDGNVQFSSSAEGVAFTATLVRADPERATGGSS